jgi:hypothetical protein
MRWRGLVVFALSLGPGTLEACGDDTVLSPVADAAGRDGATTDATQDRTLPAAEGGADGSGNDAAADISSMDAGGDAGYDATADAGDADAAHDADRDGTAADANEAGRDSAGVDAADSGPVTTYGVLHNGFVYTLNAVTAPALTLRRGVTYTFNFGNTSLHPFIFTADSAGGTIVGELTPGQLTGYVQGGSCNGNCAAAFQVITPDANTPSSFYYQCAVHTGMGAAVTVIP